MLKVVTRQIASHYSVIIFKIVSKYIAIWKIQITAFPDSHKSLDWKIYISDISQENHFYGTLCWWKMLKIKLSFKWYQSRGDLIRFTFWSLSTKWYITMPSGKSRNFGHKKVKIMSKKICPKFDTLFTKWTIFLLTTLLILEGQQNSSPVACCWKTLKINTNKMKHQKKRKIRTKYMWFLREFRHSNEQK